MTNRSQKRGGHRQFANPVTNVNTISSSSARAFADGMESFAGKPAVRLQLQRLGVNHSNAR
jgi:hypothetical protein